MPVEPGEQAHHADGDRRQGKHRQQCRQSCRGCGECCEDGEGERTHKCQLNANLCVKDFANDRPSAVPIAGPRRLLDQKPRPLLFTSMLRLR
jgi:hypothetical protein